jgi:hypothetical protein
MSAAAEPDESRSSAAGQGALVGSTVAWKPAMMLANVSSSDLRLVLASWAEGVVAG